MIPHTITTANTQRKIFESIEGSSSTEQKESFQNKINQLPLPWEDWVISLLNFNNKLVLGGNLSLYTMDIVKYDFTTRHPDIDFSLTEPLTPDELVMMMDFFNLDLKNSPDDYHINNDGYSSRMTLQEILDNINTRSLIQLVPKNPAVTGPLTIDLFNHDYIKKRDVVNVFYKTADLKLRMNHPSVTLQYKARYAFDNRVGKSYKHFTDLKEIDWSKYFKIISLIHHEEDGLTLVELDSLNRMDLIF